MQQTLQIHIPFSGFYESIHSDTIDHAVENLVSDDDGEPMQTHLDALYDIIPWNLVRGEYAKEYVAHLDARMPLDLPLQFEELDSPREYNFTTDRVYCTVPSNFMVTLLNAVLANDGLRDAFDTVCREWFTSRSGFSSFYEPDWREWAGIEDASEWWDTNQWSAVFAAWYTINMGGYDSAEDTEGCIVDCMQGNGGVEQCIGNAIHAYDVLYPPTSTQPTRHAQFGAILNAAYEERRGTAGRRQLPTTHIHTGVNHALHRLP